LRKPLFAGSNNEGQLQLICDLVGPPSYEAIQDVKKPRIQDFFYECYEANTGATKVDFKKR